jgi:predicted RNA methylase
MEWHPTVRGRVAVAILWAVACGAAWSGSPPEWAAGLLSASGVSGGLVAHVGCGDGSRTVALRASEALTVLGLDADPDSVARAREFARSQGLAGPVVVDRFDAGRLPPIEKFDGAPDGAQ